MTRWIAAALAALGCAALPRFLRRPPPLLVVLPDAELVCHHGEHAPFYYGKAKGIYATENTNDLEIQEGRGSAATTQAVAAKTADFGYVDVPTGVMMRATIKGAPVIATGVLLQTSPTSVMGFVDKNIRKPGWDIKGKTSSRSRRRIRMTRKIWPLFLEKTGLKESDFNTVAGDGQTKLNAVHQRPGRSPCFGYV